MMYSVNNNLDNVIIVSNFAKQLISYRDIGIRTVEMFRVHRLKGIFCAATI